MFFLCVVLVFLLFSLEEKCHYFIVNTVVAALAVVSSVLTTEWMLPAEQI